VGDKVVYPMHGAGIVESIEEKEILGKKQEYYVLNFPLGGVKVMVPPRMWNRSDYGRLFQRMR